MPNKITTQQLFDQYVAMNEKLDALDQKINGIIDGSTPANTQLTGSNVENNSLIKVFKNVDQLVTQHHLVVGNNAGVGGMSSTTSMSIRGYRKLKVIIRNNHTLNGEPVAIRFLACFVLAESKTRADTVTSLGGFLNVTIPADSTFIIDAANTHDIPILEEVFTSDILGEGLLVQLGRAPEGCDGGSVDIYVLGGK